MTPPASDQSTAPAREYRPQGPGSAAWSAEERAENLRKAAAARWGKALPAWDWSVEMPRLRERVRAEVERIMADGAAS